MYFNLAPRTPQANLFSGLFSFYTLLFSLIKQLLLNNLSIFTSGFSSLNLGPVLSVLVIGTEDVIPPSERSGVVVGEGHVVEVVMVSTRPEWKDVLEGPREVITRVGVDGLEQAKGNPDIHGRDVEFSAGVNGPEDRAHESTQGEDESLQGVGIFSCEAEWSAVFVVQFVDVAIQWAVM